jgi:two-component system, LuxR family, response regulator TtrR
MRNNDIKVYIVDDDEPLRDSLAWLLEGDGMRVRTYESAETFLRAVNTNEAAVLVLDVRMPGMSGIALQERLLELDCRMPLVFITGHGDVPMAVEAVKRGAFDFIEKPFNDEKILGIIKRAAERLANISKAREEEVQLDKRLTTLTTREREVMELVIKGKLNKTIADILGISIKTVEAHRARVMEKMQVKSLAELVQMTMPK